eukprot:tig00000178_g12735.t1
MECAKTSGRVRTVLRESEETSSAALSSSSDVDGSSIRKRMRSTSLVLSASVHPEEDTSSYTASAEDSNSEAYASAAAEGVDPEFEFEAAAAPIAIAISIEQLPDVILSKILECLGLKASAATRFVCRRWRDAADAVFWHQLDLKLYAESADELAGLLIGAQDLDWSQLDDAARAEIIWQRAGRGHRIRVAAGASLRLEVTPVDIEDIEVDGLEVWQSTLSLLAACAAAAGAASGTSTGHGGLGAVDVDCSCSPDSSCIADMLNAVVPPSAPVCRSLRNLSLRAVYSRFKSEDSFSLGVGPNFRRLIFPNLESLLAIGNEPCFYACRADAEALARCLPNLKRVCSR